MIHRFSSLLAAGLSVMLVGCAPAASTPTATTPPTATPTSTPIPVTPTLHASLTEPILVEDPVGRRTALGLIRNRAPHAVEGIELEVTFLSATGDMIRQEQVVPVLPYLASGGASPVEFQYEGNTNPASVTLEVVRYEVREALTVQPGASLQTALAGADGGTRVLGELELHDDVGAVRIDGFAVASADAEGKLTSLARSIAATSYLAPGDRLPFEAFLPTRVPLTSIQTYGSASPTDRRQNSPVQVIFDPGWSFDPQGRPFLIGFVHNPTGATVTAEILLSIRTDGELRQVTGLDLRVPLAPGEQRPFGVRDPALPKDADPAALEAEPIIVPPAPGEIPPRVQSLRMQVTGAEALGSNYFLRGRVSNEGPEAVASPTLIAALRATDGTLWTAGWLRLGDEFEAGQSEPFVLSLPLPEGVEVPLGEFDVRAIGTTPH